jgi:pentapeptide repeat protein
LTLPCCKAEKYKWCSEQHTVYTDKKGKEYCVFHAPKEQKGQTEDNFNKLIFERIQVAIDEKETCYLSGTIFPWEITFNHFNKDNPLPELYFSYSTFSDYANFKQAVFSGIASFVSTAFNGYANFKQAVFNEVVGFGLAVFNGNADFERAVFNGNANFMEAVFNGEASFLSASFNGEASFLSAVFTDYTNFEQAVFSGKAVFADIAFSGIANFMSTAFNGWANFTSTAFKGEVIFVAAVFNGNADFERAVFSGYAYFMKAVFNGNADFLKAVFNEEVGFEEVYFIERAYFRETTFSDDVLFRMCSVDKMLYFENIDLSHVSFLDSDPLMMHFTNCKWPRIFGRNVLFDEIEMKKEQGSFEKVEDLYRKLKYKYKAENNEPEVSNWHYGEKEMFRKKMNWRRFNPVSFSNLYWASSGYGERPLRAGMVLIFLFASATILMNVFGLISASEEEIFGVKIIKGFYGVIEWNKFWLLIYNTIQNALFIKATFFKPQTLAGVIFLTITTKLIIPIQVALFVLALRNKFRR